MKRSVPDPSAMVSALAARVDALEQDTRVLRTDADGLGRGYARLTTQIDRLANRASTTTGAGAGGTSGTAGRSAPTGPGAADDEGQPDWLTVTDPDVAVAWVTAADIWARDILTRHGLALTSTPCWPIHPDVVGDLLALIAQREEAYGGAKPAAVSEWLTRWLPAGIDRIRGRLAVCLDERGHSQNSRIYDAKPVDPAHAAHWWATDRNTPAPKALALRAVD